MSLIEVDYGEVSGGGASGTLPTTTASTEYTISTGLSSVSKFSMWATDIASSLALMSFCAWDADAPTVYQSGAGAENNVGSCAKDQAIGTASSVTVNKERCMIVMDVTGGNVKVKTPTVAVWANFNWTWVAV